MIHLYVRRHYHINQKIIYTEESSSRSGMAAQHVTAVVLDGTDIVILTVFTSLSMVSIYSVYYQVVKGVNQLFLSMTNSIQSLMDKL